MRAIALVVVTGAHFVGRDISGAIVVDVARDDQGPDDAADRHASF